MSRIMRIRNRHTDEDEDVYLDTIGYLILLRIAEREAGQP